VTRTIDLNKLIIAENASQRENTKRERAMKTAKPTNTEEIKPNVQHALALLILDQVLNTVTRQISSSSPLIDSRHSHVARVF
jgi:hypothetical protein